MKAIAVIPARGGSVGLPGKNIRKLNGIPLVGRCISAALGAKSVSAVYVSSDADDILDVAVKCGASAIRRPESISGSTASSESALVHALDTLSANGEQPADIVVFLQCTSPFTTAAHIDEVVARLVDEQASCAFSVVEDHGFIWSTGADGAARGITHDETMPRQRRQDMEPRYRETGAIYAMRIDDFRTVGNRFCGRTVLVPVDMPSIEIDTPEDWEIAEIFARQHDSVLESHRNLSKIKALITDFDGVHTDDRVTVLQDGTEAVVCSRSDGMGIEMLRNAGLRLLILSREQNPVVKARAAKLRMEVQNQVLDKLPTLDQWRQENGLEWAQIAYVGNDLNDLDCMLACGLSFAPADAHPRILEIARIVLKKEGGRGALRELSEFLLAHDLIG